MRYVKVSRLAWRAWLKMRKIGIFRNRSGVKPGRLGFYILGLEIGSRNPGDPVGVWLKEHGLWPW